MRIARLFYKENSIELPNCVCGFTINRDFRLIIRVYPFFDIVNETLIGFRVEEELQCAQFGDGVAFKRIHTAEHTADINELNANEEWTTRLAASWGFGISINLRITSHYDIELGYYYDIEVERKKPEKEQKSVEDKILDKISFLP